MERFIPYEKLSKKKKREIDAARRGSWRGINPVTRKTVNRKAEMKKTGRWMYDSDLPVFFCLPSLGLSSTHRLLPDC